MIRNLSDENLWSRTKILVGNEKEATLLVLDHLREVERRMLFAKRGYSSLFAYCCQELGYSEDEAQRRISAMRTIRDLPQARKSLEAGSVSLSTLSEYRSFIHRQEKHQGHKLAQHAKEEIFALIQNKSRRECEHEFIKLQPEVVHARESTRPLSAELTEIKFVASRELMDKLGELRDLLGNRDIGGHAELIGVVADLALKQLKKTKATQVGRARFGRPDKRAPLNPILSTLPAKVDKPSRYIPNAIRAAVWRRDRGCCQYEDPVSGRKCLSRHAVQFDHAFPLSLGGETSIANLRLRCRTHNQLHAVETLSWDQMRRFLPSIRD